MCGIAFIKRYGEEPITVDQIRWLLLSLEERGTHASGVALMKGDEIEVYKADEPASEFVTSKAFESFIEKHLHEDTDIMTCHTRWVTQGDPRFNKNNHPMWNGVSAVVHNGCISNDDYLFSELKLERSCDTDSDIIRAIVDAEGIERGTIKTLNKLSGSCAAAIISRAHPGKLLVLRSGSPLFMAATEGQLLGASTKDALHLATRPWISRFGDYFQDNRTPAAFAAVPDNTARIYGPTGKEWHDQFKSCYHYSTPDYSTAWTGFKGKNNRATEDQPTYMICPNKDCKDKDGKRTRLEIKSKHKHTPLWNMECTVCKTTLGTKPNVVMA